MGVLAVTTPTRAGTANPGAAVAASDTIARGILGSLGGILEIINGGGSTDNMTISDASGTPTGAAAAALAPSVANGTNKVFLLLPDMFDRATGLVTITHSFITSVTYKLYPIG
jgi:hypothetical protein